MAAVATVVSVAVALVAFATALFVPKRAGRWPVLLAGIVSVATTIGLTLRGGTDDEPVHAVLALLEVAALGGLIVLAVRDSPGRLTTPAVLPAGLGMAGWVLRFGEPDLTVAALAGWAVWGCTAVIAVFIGVYLRSLRRDRERSVLDARRAQRAILARDLHDFVAHDLSSVLAQAQAGQIVASRDPAAAVVMFEQIERSALEALASLDRTVHMLDEATPAALTPQHGLHDLPALVERFGGPISPDIDADADVPREVGAAAYRIVVEALTNVRRHAAGATRVSVTVRRTGGALEVVVTNSAANSRRFDRKGGTGLIALTAAVEALGGTLIAGPMAEGWQVTAVLPAGG